MLTLDKNLVHVQIQNCYRKQVIRDFKMHKLITMHPNIPITIHLPVCNVTKKEALK